MWEQISPDFRRTHTFLAEFSVQAFGDGERVSEYLNFFALDAVFSALDEEAFGDAPPISAPPPDFERLCRLHFLALTRKTFCPLALGAGHETIALAEAMRLLSEHFGEWAAAHAPDRAPFQVYAVEEDPRRAEETTRRLGARLGPFATVARSDAETILHDNRPVSVYAALPDVRPDFVYLGGPAPGAPKGAVGGLSLSAPGRPALSADALRYEFLFEPGALIVMDGRAANARLLRAYLRRPWSYAFEPTSDAHFFELCEDPYDAQNRQRLDFCLGGEWLLD